MRCYICNREITDNPKDATQCKAHGEHIIHNGIRGKLISKTILCEECGGAYSKEDSAFCKIFDAIIAALSDRLIPADHGKDTVKVLKASIDETPDSDPDGPNLKVTVKDGVAAPLQPYYEIDGDKITIYAQKGRVENYINVVAKELKAEGKNIADYTIEKVTDIHDKGYLAYYFSKDNDNFNRDFQQGMVKIATEYALHCGVPHEQLKDVLTIHADGTANIDYENAKLIPFCPTTLFDFLFEDSRYRLEEGYPSHVLKLFSSTYADGKTILYCYIDLFSTFQFYVVLDENYTGEEISEMYAQRLIARTTEKPDVTHYRPKDLMIILQEYGIDMSQCPGNSYSDQVRYVQECIRKYPLQTYDFQQALERAREQVLNYVISYLVGKVGKGNLTADMYAKIQRFVEVPPSPTGIIEMHLEGTNKEDIALLPEAFRLSVDPQYYRKYCFDVVDGDVMNYSQPDESLKVYDKFCDLATKFAYAKFSHLNCLCHNPEALWEDVE